MTKPLRVWFPEFETEAHRASWEAARLVAALADEGIECTLKMGLDCQAVFVASFSTFLDAAYGYRKYPFNRPIVGYHHFPEVPVIQYCWDLYPFKVEIPNDESERWKAYLKELKKAREIWVPSTCTVDRVRQYTGREATVVKTSIPLWEPPDGKVWDGRYVVDVVRKYPGEPNADACRTICAELGIPCVELNHGLSWDDFRKTIAGASFLVSPNYEASTGGLTLLEGYRLGKPVLLSNSPRHGGIDYFGERAHYFQWDSQESLGEAMINLWRKPPRLNRQRCQEWVEGEYSNRAFARRIADGLRRVVECAQ